MAQRSSNKKTRCEIVIRLFVQQLLLFSLHYDEYVTLGLCLRKYKANMA